MSKKVTKKIKDIDKINENPKEYAKSLTVVKLVSILQKLSDYYYGETRPLVDDDIFDEMFDVLRERDPDNAFLFQTGVSKTTGKDIKLPYSMPSLNKIKPAEKSLTRWFNTYKGPYLIMDKLDGISMQLFKDKDGEIDIYTKKQTDIGTSKKHLLKYFIDEKVLKNMPNNTSIRGEVVISKKDFEKILKFDSDLKNPRSAMAGLINTDKIDTRIAKYAQFVTYNILSPRYDIEKQTKLLKKWGFKTVWSTQNLTINENNDDIEIIEKELTEILTIRKLESDYLVDGIVVNDMNDVYEHNDDNPKHAMAFKMNTTSDMKDVKVKKVSWEPTMYGYLQPVIEIEPVVLTGNTTVTFVTAHNAKYVFDNNIGKGSIIKIVRSGDVIPYIVSVVIPSKKPDMPNIEYEWNETNVEIIVKNPSDDILNEINMKKILHFFRTLNVKYLSEGIIKKLYDAGYDSIDSIIIASWDEDDGTYNIDGLGKRMMTKIYEEVKKAFKQIKLYDLMSGSLVFGRGFGVKKLKEIVKVYPNILIDFKDLNKNEICINILKVDGFSDLLSSKFANNFKKFLSFLKNLRKICNGYCDLSFETKKKEKTKSNIDFSNEKIVMTGFRSDIITNFIEDNGGKISSSVSKNTTLVIHADADKSSSKMDKALELGIQTISLSEFKEKYSLE